MSGKADHKSQVTPDKSHMTTEQIASQMNEIDFFLQSLKVGGLRPDPALANASTTTTTTTKVCVKGCLVVQGGK